MLHTLYGKLAAVLLGLFALVALGAVLGTVHVVKLYSLEASQRLHQDLAAHLVVQNAITGTSSADASRLSPMFAAQMMINPAIHIYLLDRDGRVLAGQARDEASRRVSVSLEPVDRYLSAQRKLPILGDDPRDASKRRIFSAVALGDGSGYLYVVLADPVADAAVGVLDSYVMRLATAGVIGTIVLALLMGLVLFALITRKVRRLDAMMQQFQASDFTTRPSFPVLPATRHRDEIDRLTLSLRDLASRVVSQVQKLKQTDQLRRELVANVSHDLKTPLASLQGYVDTLLIKDGLLSAQERRTYLSVASRSCERLGKLVSDLIDLAKLDANEVVPNPEAFSVAELLHDVAQKSQLKAEQRKVALRVDVAQGAPFVHADIGLIERVLENLIGNALAHTDAGGSVTLGAYPVEQAVAVHVSDSGSGIAAEDLEHVFERFYRVNGSTWEQGGNAGLGLAITKSILDLHGSQMKVESQLGVGTRFIFKLPAASLKAAA